MPLSDSLPLNGRKILVGVTGGIAAYKAALLIRALRRAGASVQVVMTEHAERFISPLTLGALADGPVHSTLWPEHAEAGWTQHVHLGLWADLMLVAPATAQTLSKLANGACDNMLTAVALSLRCPLVVCPAMDHDMYCHPATQANLDTLRERGVHVMPPETGPLASGLVGEGRLPEPDTIVDYAIRVLSATQDRSMSGKRVLVTAGPTREHVDPVRFLSNPSTGTMGFAIAGEAARRGADVTLIAGPVALETPPGVTRIDVTTATQMHAAAMEHGPSADLIVMTAAVADYAPADTHAHKTEKGRWRPDAPPRPHARHSRRVGSEQTGWTDPRRLRDGDTGRRRQRACQDETKASRCHRTQRARRTGRGLRNGHQPRHAATPRRI